MTGTTSSRGRIFHDFDSYKNQEWLRRRKLRLEQVRKQSNDLAKTLRQKAVSEDRTRCDKYERMRDADFRDWKAEKLLELEHKLRSALEEFGQGYQEAEAEPNPEEVIEERNKVNQVKAQKRGLVARQEELRRKKLAEQKKMLPIERKRMTRKMEDLRSTLIRSILVRNQSDVCERSPQVEGPHKKKITLVKKKTPKTDQTSPEKKVPMKKVKKKKPCEVDCRQCEETNEDTCTLQEPSTIWVNLNDVDNSSDRGVSDKQKPKQSGRSQKEKSEGMVEFFDYPSRCYSKSFRELPNLVERITSTSEPNASELAMVEEENERMESEKRIGVDTATQERGAEALRREKITRDYNNLIAKLEELHRKEKILKAQQRIPSSLVHMNDDRLSERMRTRQRLMDLKFESICYEATAAAPRPEPPDSGFLDRSAGGDSLDLSGRMSTRLSFSPSNLKTNSPVTPEAPSPVILQTMFPITTSPEDVGRFRNTPSGKQLLCDVERTLTEGRKLRETVSRKSSDLEKSSEQEKTAATSSDTGEKKVTKSQESQTDETGHLEAKSSPLEGEFGVGDDSLPLSTSTSYKSPPSVIRSYRLRQFLEYLEGLSEPEVDDLKNDPKFRNRVKKLLNRLLHETKSEEKAQRGRCPKNRTCQNPALEYYVEKLLNMSRECVANLSVSSENISTPNITDLENADEVDSKYLTVSEHSRGGSSPGEHLIRQSRLSRAEKLEEAIKNWKAILERNTATAEVPRATESEDEPDCLLEKEGKIEMDGPPLTNCSPKKKNRYEEITKKCSERIWELTHMLENVRRDKEKLLGSTSEGSSICLSQTHSDKPEDEERRPHPEGVAKTSPVLESFINRYKLTRPGSGENASTAAVADSHSCQNTNESLESCPDVMDELLKREIISSPFKWSHGDFSADLTAIEETAKPSSIETVIGNFRKEMSRIKPFSIVGAAESSGDRCQDVPRSVPRRQEESSMESINHALTSLGLNWAKSFLKKNEESKAITSSSGSSDEGQVSEEEEGKFFYRRRGAE